MIPSQGSNKLMRLGIFRQPIAHMGRRLSTDPGIKQTFVQGATSTNGSTISRVSLRGKVFAVPGGGRGLGLAMAEALVEAGGEDIQNHHSHVPLVQAD
jgi:hypothetical protein